MPLPSKDNFQPSDETPLWASALLLSILRRMNESDVDKLDEKIYHVKDNSSLFYPFQLFGLFSAPEEKLPIRSPSSTRCELLLSLLLSVNCATKNPFADTLHRIMLCWLFVVMGRNTRYTDVQVVENEACAFSFDALYELVCRDLKEPPVLALGVESHR